MAIDSILEHILSEGARQREAILRDAAAQAGVIDSAGKQAAGETYLKILHEETERIALNRKRRLIAVRLEIRNDILRAKQEIIDRLFTEWKTTLRKGTFQKQQVSFTRMKAVAENTDFFLTDIRRDFETEIASILFS
jgi:vacuolar-type H+-ATPase subunit E/Vma4